MFHVKQLFILGYIRCQFVCISSLVKSSNCPTDLAVQVFATMRYVALNRTAALMRIV